MLIDSAESARMDRITARCATILECRHGNELDTALAGYAKRYGKSDADFRTYALSYIHPADLAECLNLEGSNV